MFSGIIEQKTTLRKKEEHVFTFDNPFHEKIYIGQSIAHDGICLSVTAINDFENTYDVHVVDETLHRTYRQTLQIGSSVNLERSIQMQTLLDGHLVSGHIDCTVLLQEKVEQPDGAYIMQYEIDSSQAYHIIEKGSIALNGISLTVASIAETMFTVRIIPQTKLHTNICNFDIGSAINCEFDMIGKYIHKYLANFTKF